jgi:hypothetical protein
MALIFNNNLLNQLFGKEFNKISVVPIDVTISETHTRNQSITRRTIEGGSTKVDNIIILPNGVSMNCIIKSDLFGDSFEEKLAKIDQIRLAREPFDIVTSLGTYESMFFDGAINISRETSNNTVLAFTATFSHLDFIKTDTTTVDLESSAKDAAGKRTNGAAVDVGKKQLQEEADSSVLFDLVGGVFS